MLALNNPYKALPQTTSLPHGKSVLDVPDLTAQVALVERHHQAFGGFADIHRGLWRRGNTGDLAVSVKVPRVYGGDSEIGKARKTEKLRRELRVWHRLKHENILPLYGTVSDLSPLISMVSPWVEKGDLVRYLAVRHELLTDLDRVRMLCDVASGMDYLHRNDVVHGGLSGANILVNENDRCIICDFGLSTFLEEVEDSSYIPNTFAGSIRWAAPELFMSIDDVDKRALPNKASDVFSLGRVIYHVITGKVPFQLIPEMRVIIQLAQGTVLPPRPEGMADDLWSLFTLCSSMTPNSRPDIQLCYTALRNKHLALQYTLQALPDLTGQVTTEDTHRADVGSHAEVFRGTWRTHTFERPVAIKTLRQYPDQSMIDLQKKSARLRRELRVWSSLKHENVLELYGTASNFGFYPSMICPWASNGNLTKFIASRHGELTAITRLRMLCEVAVGLKYLHDVDVVHGDLSGGNILVDGDEHCLICDFGLSMVIQEIQGTSSLTANPGTYRWAAPEMIDLDSGTMANKRSDVFSFGRIMYQVLSGNVPFHHLKDDIQVILRLSAGESLARPENFSDEQWALVTACWSVEPSDRPEIHTCVEALHAAVVQSRNPLEVDINAES